MQPLQALSSVLAADQVLTGREVLHAYGRDESPAEPCLPSCNAMLVLGSGPSHSERLETVGSLCKNFHLWQEKIKDALDPDYLSDPSAYVVYKGNLVRNQMPAP